MATAMRRLARELLAAICLVNAMLVVAHWVEDDTDLVGSILWAIPATGLIWGAVLAIGVKQ